MARPQGSVENENPRFNRVMWRVERITWGLMALIILAALLGLLGAGPLSHATAGKPGAPVWVEYDRFAHAQTPTRLRVHLAAPSARADTVDLWVSRSLQDELEIQSVTPKPERVEATGDGMVFVFKFRPGAGEFLATLDATPLGPGRLEGELGLTGGPRVALRQLIYP
jgi:hypothetical protein